MIGVFRRFRRFAAVMGVAVLAVACADGADMSGTPAISGQTINATHASYRAISGSYVPLTSAEGRARLARSAHKADFFALSTTFTTQERQTLCSVATGVTVLNALDIDKPVDPTYAPHAFFTQRNYFNDAVEAIVTREVTLKIGQTLEQSARVMGVHGAEAQHHHAAEFTPAAFRDAVKANMARTGDFIAINYRRNFIGQPPGSHFSPIAAYDEQTDSVLIMDVARYKFPPVWASIADVHRAMNTFDSDSGMSRGYIDVGRP